MVLAAVTQIYSRASVTSNLLACQSVIQRAAASKARIVFLPEASDFIAPPNEVAALSRPFGRSEFVEGIKESARREGVWVGVGVHESSEDARRCFNTNLVISPTEGVVQAYRKVHLFDVDIAGGATILESNTTVPGESLLDPVPTPIGNEVLLRARAIETQSYVGKSSVPTRQSYGHALIVDPWGTVIAQGKDQAPPAEGEAGEDHGTFSLADIDLDWLRKVRLEMPLWEQRRYDVYPRL
ncbi:putative NIT2-nitrilase [Pseudohyphozyma bogoriensis]|nr:putative NIT2-nitrilase [Pseudohyphozyma bogoriensis]